MNDGVVVDRALCGNRTLVVASSFSFNRSVRSRTNCRSVSESPSIIVGFECKSCRVSFLQNKYKSLVNTNLSNWCMGEKVNPLSRTDLSWSFNIWVDKLIICRVWGRWSISVSPIGVTCSNTVCVVSRLGRLTRCPPVGGFSFWDFFLPLLVLRPCRWMIKNH